VLNTVPAHVKLIERDNILREVIPDAVIRAELTLDRFIGCQEIYLSEIYRHLHKQKAGSECAGCDKQSLRHRFAATVGLPLGYRRATPYQDSDRTGG
jgi:hypothetical protein